ncbi:15122_t:CDS:2 [Funneliformis geosporum]|uniref:15122_t:CDS:1 n=1 Tax=Funneliformis geosporum TaxID=1117311 RepID=A0A9W4SV11_9GLOM|nr:15122_t:CDS:2 [Funneliformis geosporum]
MTDNKFNKKELQNKLQGFAEGQDYSILAENGKQVYDIHSSALKKSLWGDRIPVWCKIEVYDNENEHYRGRFEGYENGYQSLQNGLDNNLIEIGSSKNGSDYKSETGKAEGNFANQKNKNPWQIGENIGHGDKFAPINPGPASDKHNEEHLASLRESQSALDQQNIHLKAENKSLEQQLAQERQTKKEIEEQAQAERNNLQNELNQLRQELRQTQEKITQLQAELKTELTKTSNPDTQKVIKQLTKTQQELKKIDQLTPKNNPQEEQLNSLREQLDNSQQALSAAAAHRQSLLPVQQVQSAVKSQPPALSQPKSKAPYLVGGLVFSGVSLLILGYFLGKEKKRNKN